MWAEFPIVEQVGNNWDLTDFGKLVGYVLFELDQDYIGWIHRYALDDEFELEEHEYRLVDKALIELEI